jgi:desulfoferrodoxin (superoxide reductase-like protein)
MKKNLFILFTLLCFAFANAMANKTSTEVKAPAEAKKGTEVTIMIKVDHSANSKSHHTDWVVLRINGKEIKRWTYDKNNLPPDSVFTLEYKYVAGEDLNIETEGHCNMHGSKGITKFTVKTSA